MSKQKRLDLDLPRPEKVLADMTRQERAAYRQAIKRALRDDHIRMGLIRPRTAREREIWLAGVAERKDRQAKRVTRAERRRSRLRD